MYVRSQSELEELCLRIREVGRVALDAEFIRDRSYYPQLALLQLAVGEDSYLVDPLELQDLTSLEAVVNDDGVRKILHAATQDLEIFYHRTQQPPKNVFDTQIAAAMLGMGSQISYAGLVERVLGKTLRKGAAFTDWLHRPLSREQEEYALDDVRYLLAVHDSLANKLEELGRASWVEEEFLRFADPHRYIADPERLYQKVRRFGTLDPKGLAVLRELASWREKEAQRRDRPRRHVVGDEVLVEVARSAPKEPDELRRMRGLHPQLFKRAHKQILEAVDRGRRTPPEKRPRPSRQRRLDANAQLAVTFLDACLRTHCQRVNLDPSMIATSGDLQALVGGYYSGSFEASDYAMLQGWRGELVGKNILAFLEGKVSIRLDPATRSPILTQHEDS